MHHIYPITHNSFYDLSTRTHMCEFRPWYVSLMIVFQKTNILKNDNVIVQWFTGKLIQKFNSANIPFTSTQDPEVEIRKFASKHGIGLTSWPWSKPIQGYTSINDFFSRRFAIAPPVGDTDIISPATGTVRLVQNRELMEMKWQTYDIQMCGIPYPDDYADGSGFYHYLSPADYHGFHAPVDGRIVYIVDARDTHDTPHHSASVKPDLIYSVPSIFAFNKRYIVVIEMDSGARVVVMIIGGFLVDSIRMEGWVAAGKRVKKGVYMGSFALGGSAVYVATTEPVKLNDTIREFLERDVPVKVTVNGAIGDL
jgi:phosphatidylserine decarboxylase